MAIKRDKNDLEFEKFKESSSSAGQPGVVVINPDGSSIGNAAGGTQYTEGGTDTTITGTAIMWEDTSDTLRVVSASKPLPVSIISGSVTVDTTGLATSAKQDTIIGHLDGVEGLLTTIDGDTGTLAGTDFMLGTDFSAVFGTGTLVTTTQADDLANTLDGINTTSFLYAFDGTTWDRLRGDSTNGLLVNLGANNDVTVTSSALPTGAATLAEQQTQTTALTTIDGSINNVVTNTATIATPVNTIGTTDVFNVAVFNGADGQITDFATQTTLAAINAKLVTGTVIGDVNLGATDNAVLDAIAASVAAIDTDASTIIGHVDGIETVLGTIDTDTGNMATSLGSLDNAVDGNYLNVNMNVAGTDVVSGSGTATGALRVELPTNGTGVIATVGAVTSITNALPAGTNAIGKLAANSGVDIGDVDVTSVSGTVTTKGIPSDIDINGSNANHADKYYTNAGAVTDGIVWSPAAGKRWHVLTLYINVSAAATVTLEDDLAAGDNVRWKGELAANSGVVLTYDKEHPFSSGEDAADLLITTSAGNVYVQAVGYEV